MTKSKLSSSLAANSKTIIYQAKDGAISLKTDNNQENVWANQFQIAELFKIDQSVVSRHINKIFKDVKKIDPQTLTALTLLIAESDPKDKDKMIGLVMMLLGNARNRKF